MFYAKEGPESDVTVKRDVDGFYQCARCKFLRGRAIMCRHDERTTMGMLDHLRAHVLAGHRVPDSVFTLLSIAHAGEVQDG